MTDVLTFEHVVGIEISSRRRLPDGDTKAIVQIAPGASERSAAYAYGRFTAFLTGHGHDAAELLRLRSGRMTRTRHRW